MAGQNFNAVTLANGMVQLASGRVVSMDEFKFLRAVAGKQRINTHFYDTKTIAAGGLGAAGTPAQKLWFDGQTVNDSTLTGFVGKQQMEQDEVFDIVGMSITSMPDANIAEGATAAAISANTSRDVSRFIYNTSVVLRIGSNDYGPWVTHAIGGDGGVGGTTVLSNNVAAVTQLYSAPSNGAALVGQYWHFAQFIRWTGNKNLTISMNGTTGALSAALPVRICVYGAPYYRNYRPETGLNFAIG